MIASLTLTSIAHKMTKLLTPDYFINNTCLFKDNYLHEMPTDVQHAIMGAVAVLDEQEKMINNKLNIIYMGWQHGNTLYGYIADFINAFEDDDLTFNGFIMHVLESDMGDEGQDTYDKYKKYIVDEYGLVDAMDDYRKEYGVDFKTDLYHNSYPDDPDDPDDISKDCVYANLMKAVAVTKLRAFFKDDDWDMICNHRLHSKLVELRENE